MNKYFWASLFSLLGFVAVYLLVRDGFAYAFDHTFEGLGRTESLTALAFVLTDAGSWVFVTIASLFLVLYLSIKNRYREVWYVFVSVLGALAFETVFKYFSAVSRPPRSLVDTFGASFPSGHATMVTVLCAVVYLYVLHFFKNKNEKTLAFIFLTLFAFLVGASRVYLDAHWPSDVVAGWLIGFFWAVLPLSFKHPTSTAK